MSFSNVRISKSISGLILAALVAYTGFLTYFASQSSAAFECDINRSFALLSDAGSLCQWSVVFDTTEGNIEIKLVSGLATTTVANFLKLADDGFYDGTKFHRVIKNFMIQGGDPLSREDDRSVYGTGGPGYSFRDEINGIRMTRGVIAMANSGPDTNGSQFFIITAAQTPWLQGAHTVFGEVVKGMEIVDKISLVPTDENDVPLNAVVLEKAYIKN